jgi:hypothetical protein
MANWAAIAERQAFDYGTISVKGHHFLVISLIWKKQDQLNVTGRMIEGHIPSCADINGIDFTSERMADYLRGLSNLYPEYVQVVTTHDLNSFRITDTTGLFTAIRQDIR